MVTDDAVYTEHAAAASFTLMTRRFAGWQPGSIAFGRKVTGVSESLT